LKEEKRALVAGRLYSMVVQNNMKISSEY